MWRKQCLLSGLKTQLKCWKLWNPITGSILIA
jgi:hypothetical protein